MLIRLGCRQSLAPGPHPRLQVASARAAWFLRVVPHWADADSTANPGIAIAFASAEGTVPKQLLINNAVDFSVLDNTASELDVSVAKDLTPLPLVADVTRARRLCRCRSR